MNFLKDNIALQSTNNEIFVSHCVIYYNMKCEIIEYQFCCIFSLWMKALAKHEAQTKLS